MAADLTTTKFEKAGAAIFFFFSVLTMGRRGLSDDYGLMNMLTPITSRALARIIKRLLKISVYTVKKSRKK